MQKRHRLNFHGFSWDATPDAFTGKRHASRIRTVNQGAMFDACSVSPGRIT